MWCVVQSCSDAACIRLNGFLHVWKHHTWTISNVAACVNELILYIVLNWLFLYCSAVALFAVHMWKRLYFSARSKKKITVKTRGSTYRDRPGQVLPGETWRLPPPAVPSLSGGCRKCCSWIRIPRCPCPCCHTSAHCCGSPRLEMWWENWCHYVQE